MSQSLSAPQVGQYTGGMKKYFPIIEDGIIAGNLYDKYGARNPIAKWLVRGFLAAFEELTSMAGVSDVHEVGCGEGYLTAYLAKKFTNVRASDISCQVIEKARDFAMKNALSVRFKVSSIYNLTPKEDKAELVVCCEVLEHLEDPPRALKILSDLANPYLLVSVPREPIWRILNITRGSYLMRLGNTPGHLQHWSKESFLRMVDASAHVEKVLTPLPWTMALCRVR